MMPETKNENVKRPAGVTIIAILASLAAAILGLGSFACFFVAVLDITGGDARDPVSIAIAGMAVAGGFSLLVLAGLAACLAIGVLRLREWARIVSVASIGVGIACTVLSLFATLGYRVIPIVPMIVMLAGLIAIGTWMLAYLVRPRVKQAFGAATA